MGDLRARTGFGHVDLEVDEATGEAFGELDWDVPDTTLPPEIAHPASSTQPSATPNTRQTVRRDDAEMESVVDSTRIVSNAALSPVLEEERDKTPPPSSRHGGHHGAPSASGVAMTDRVALMREAYARGDAEGALAIASSMEGATMPPPPGGFDHPDAAIDVEISGEAEIDIEEQDPVDVEDLTRVAPSASLPGMPAIPTRPPPGTTAPPPLASLTERHGIPRVLVGPEEIAKLPIDHRAGFLLGVIDGMQTMEEILDVCAMPPNDALELIRTLVDMGVIDIE